MEEIKELEPQEIQTNDIEHEKIHKKIRFKLIEVTVATILVMVLIAFNQGKKLFQFDFLSDASTDDTIQTLISGKIFGYIVYGFLAFILLFTVYLFLINRKEIMSYGLLKRHYDFYDLIGVVPVFLSVVVIINAFFISPAIVHGPSMEPTFYENDAVLIYHLNHDFEAQDIIIYDRGDALLIKRLIGLPGDQLKVDLSGVYLNGVNLEVEGYESEYHLFDGVIPEGYFFIMGDNDSKSNDSRYFGLVKAEDILGKVIIKF